MRTIIFLMISYIIAAPLTSKISLDLTQTEWSNALTYFYWLFALVIWAVIFWAVVMILATLLSRFN